METAIIQPLTKAQAEALLNDIRADCEDATRVMTTMRERLIQFDQGAGWKVLGYPSLSDCFERELGVVFQTGYARLKAAIVEMNIRQLSPPGEIIVAATIPVKHVKETGIGNLSPAAQLEAYRSAIRMAKAEGRVRPTTDDVKRGVTLEQTKGTVFQSPYAVISQMVATGSITAVLGEQMVQALNRLVPKQRGYIVQLIAKFQLTCPALFKPIAFMFDRKIGEESKVLPEVLTGFLGGTPLAKATERDLARANAEAKTEHINESMPDDGGAKALVLYTRNLDKSLAVLRREMGEAWLDMLSKRLLAS